MEGHGLLLKKVLSYVFKGSNKIIIFLAFVHFVLSWPKFSLVGDGLPEILGRGPGPPRPPGGNPGPGSGSEAAISVTSNWEGLGWLRSSF